MSKNNKRFNDYNQKNKIENGFVNSSNFEPDFFKPSQTQFDTNEYYKEEEIKNAFDFNDGESYYEEALNRFKNKGNPNFNQGFNQNFNPNQNYNPYPNPYQNPGMDPNQNYNPYQNPGMNPNPNYNPYQNQVMNPNQYENNTSLANQPNDFNIQNGFNQQFNPAMNPNNQNPYPPNYNHPVPPQYYYPQPYPVPPPQYQQVPVMVPQYSFYQPQNQEQNNQQQPQYQPGPIIIQNHIPDNANNNNNNNNNNDQNINNNNQQPNTENNNVVSNQQQPTTQPENNFTRQVPAYILFERKKNAFWVLMSFTLLLGCLAFLGFLIIAQLVPSIQTSISAGAVNWINGDFAKETIGYYVLASLAVVFSGLFFFNNAALSSSVKKEIKRISMHGFDPAQINGFVRRTYKKYIKMNINLNWFCFGAYFLIGLAVLLSFTVFYFWDIGKNNFGALITNVPYPNSHLLEYIIIGLGSFAGLVFLSHCILSITNGIRNRLMQDTYSVEIYKEEQIALIRKQTHKRNGIILLVVAVVIGIFFLILYFAKKTISTGKSVVVSAK